MTSPSVLDLHRGDTQQGGHGREIQEGAASDTRDHGPCHGASQRPGEGMPGRCAGDPFPVMPVSTASHVRCLEMALRHRDWR